MARTQITDQMLLDALVNHHLAERSDLQDLLLKQRAAFEQHQHRVSGTAYLVDLRTSELVVQSFPAMQEKKRLALSSNKLAFDSDDWDPWGNHALITSQEEGTRLDAFDFDLTALYGLVASQGRVFLYNEGRLSTEQLGLAKHALYGAVYKGKPQSSPFDLYLSPDQKWLCVSDRGAGSISVFEVESLELRGKAQIREPGSTNTLNIAIDQEKACAYITDNQSASLYVLDFNTMAVSRQRVGVGILGNLVMAPNHKYLYLISIKPNVGLHYVNLESWSAEKNIKLKGDLFKADSSSPCDLLSLSPNGEYVLLMTYLNDPEPFTPVITVIEAEQSKTLRRYSLKDGVKPFQLAYGEANPMREYTRPLEELVLEAELVGPQALWNVKRELRQQLGEDLDEDEAPVARKVAEAEPEPEPKDEEEPVIDETEAPAEAESGAEDDDFIDVELHKVDILGAIQNNPDSDTLSITPKKANHIALPPEAVAEILDILLTTFQKQIQEDVAEHPEVLNRLQQAAEKARNELEDFDSTVVQIEDLFEGKALKTVIVREAIVMMLELKEAIKDEIRVVPIQCPNCSQRLMGAWDCQTCGFELESPERAIKRRIASADATANLPHGHMVIPDPQGLRVLQLNAYKYVSWNLDPDQLSCDYPVDTLWLPNDNILVVDKDGNSLLEVGLRGKLFWHFNTQASPHHELNEPVKVTYYLPENSGERHFLIVDQGNHRVIEVNKHSEILKEFGTKGIAGSGGGALNTPSDVQFTHDRTYLIADTGNHRVIEYAENGKVERIFGEELGLQNPTCVQRLFNDHTLILDAGNYRLLELNSAGEVINECLYYTPKMEPAYRVVSPIKMIRLINKDVLIMDEDKLIQVMLHTKQLIWHSKIEDLAFQPKVEAPEIVVDENGVERLVYKVVEHGDIRPVRLSQKINFKRMQKLIEARLKADSSVSAEDEDKSSHAADKLRSLIEDRKLEQKRNLRRELVMDAVQPSEIYIKEGAELETLRYYTVDRHHNAIIRINRKGEVKWHYGFEMGQALSRPHHLGETRRTLLVSDAGNNRVVEISKADKEVVMDIRGPEKSPLGGPRSAQRLGLGRTIVADQRNKRLVELNTRNEIVWEFNKSGQIASPQYVEELENGHILFADSMLNSIREIDREGNLRWSYGSRIKGSGPGQLFAPEFATRLANGHTLIADTRNNRILEVQLDGKEVWIYEGDPVQRRKIINPTRAERLENGNTLIAYNNAREHLEVTPKGERVWYYKMGNDVFLPPVEGSNRGLKQMVEKVLPYYNPIEKRLIRSAEQKAMWGMEAHITLMENTQMKSVRASLVLMMIERSGTVVKTFPSPEELLADKFGKDLIIAFIMDPGQDPESVAEDIRMIAEVENTHMERIEFEEAMAAV